MQKVEQGLWTAINHHHMLQAEGAVDTTARKTSLAIAVCNLPDFLSFLFVASVSVPRHFD